MKSESTEQNAELVARTKAALDASANELDYTAQLQLQRARQRALAALNAGSRAPVKVWWQRQWLWLAAVPAALVLVIALPLLQSPTPASDPASTPTLAVQPGSDESWQALADLEVLADEPELDELADIEFYQWLGEQDTTGPV